MIQDRWIFKARDKIKDSITGSLNQELQKSNVSNLSETGPTCREHQTISVGNISSRFKAVGSNSALFDSCPFWLVLFLVCAIFGSCCFEDSYYWSHMSRTLNYWCRKHFIKIQDRQIFKARDKIEDCITGSLNQDLQKSNISNLSETGPTCREHQTIGVGNISSRFKTVGF